MLFLSYWCVVSYSSNRGLNFCAFRCLVSCQSLLSVRGCLPCRWHRVWFTGCWTLRTQPLVRLPSVYHAALWAHAYIISLSCHVLLLGESWTTPRWILTMIRGTPAQSGLERFRRSSCFENCVVSSYRSYSGALITTFNNSGLSV